MLAMGENSLPNSKRNFQVTLKIEKLQNGYLLQAGAEWKEGSMLHSTNVLKPTFHTSLEEIRIPGLTTLFERK